MEEATAIDQWMVAYCYGKPEHLAMSTNHFDLTLQEIIDEGHEVWRHADTAGIVWANGQWYLWVKGLLDDGSIEGRIYEGQQIESILANLCAVLPQLSADEKMEIVRRMQRYLT
ncbi:hypothetical protein AAC03nite_04720 [Alicyclobacillus acidoterrestris]|nr:hypothetical protein AAC03nite_04720 [Alicyclobacillus acidoterrestris]